LVADEAQTPGVVEEGDGTYVIGIANISVYSMDLFDLFVAGEGRVDLHPRVLSPGCITPR
jgi:hypothetical protein